MDYLRLVAELPLPTVEQTTRFAGHVAENHSWYKHLPFFPPGALFVFFLNPNAGSGVRAAGSHFSVYDIEQGEYLEHHSRLATAEYLARFGHWDYWVDNPRISERREGPWIYEAIGGGRDELPEDLKQRWSCRFTAFLKMGPIRAELFHHEREAFANYERQHSSDPNIQRYGLLARRLARDVKFDWMSNSDLHSFMIAEETAQRRRLLETLQMIREACVRQARGGG